MNIKELIWNVKEDQSGQGQVREKISNKKMASTRNSINKLTQWL
jgi:hypothetical protein